jgi:DNA-binding MarR family transcriptional regulator
MTAQIEERIARNMVDLIRVFHIMRNRGRDEGVKPPPMDPQYYILRFLLHEDLPISEIGRRLQRSKPNMSAIIGKMLRDGTVRKARDMRDLRVARIVITARGRRALEKRMGHVKSCIKSNLARLGKADKERLNSSLEIVNTIAQKVSKDADGRS